MKIECKFRTATMKDIQELKKLFCNTVMTVNRRAYTAEEVADWASCCESDGRWEQLLSTLYFIVATDVEGQMLGFTAIRGDGYLHSMFVHKDYQRQGIATALLQKIEAYASEHGIKEMTSEVSHKFYDAKDTVSLYCRRVHEGRLVQFNVRMNIMSDNK